MKLRFAHPYDKLTDVVFTTIRGKSYFRKLGVGQVITIDASSRSFLAEVQSLELRKVKELPIGFLQKDTDYSGLRINSHEEFLTLINSFRRSFMPTATLESEMTVITLKRI